ncbi:ATP-binding protein [Owenweeksia hongkongensis]|uniref:sensor histidine kinase n=1 Tax=Owenweeksia hongkongensis TaxID=253245 RepID=UPI003A8C9FF8
MKKSSFRKSLLWRLSGALLLLLICLGIAYVSITTYSARKYYQETTQKLNAHVAEHMLLEVNPFVNGEVNAEAVGKIMHSMMAVNPSLEVYLLDPQGNILKYVVLDKKVRLKNLKLEPVKQFLADSGKTFVLGDDPRNPGEETIFSATEVRNENGQLEGYVYMVLASEEYENIAGALSTSYFMKLGAQTFAITLVAAFALGIFLIALLTRNLRSVITTVKRFEEGDYHARIPIKNSGELADLSHTFNHMADTILKNIEDLKEVDKLRRELIANVSHDLRSPMSVIQGYIETMMIKGDKLSDEDRRKYLEIIFKSSEKLNLLVADLFELSKLEARQVQLQKERFNMNELLQDTAKQFQLKAKEKNIKLHTELSHESLIKADIGMMQRVIQNLMDNALKYTPEDGEITVKSVLINERLEVSITNSGKGIPEDQLPHIFDRYFMLDKDKHGIDGTGLGLAIVKKIVDIHDADISVNSIENGSTSFTVVMPAA